MIASTASRVVTQVLSKRALHVRVGSGPRLIGGVGRISRSQQLQLHAPKSLSSVAAVVPDEEPIVKKKASKSKRRRTLQAKDPIIVTERAADRIKELLAGDNAEGAIGIILGVKRRGCNGLSYTLNYAFDEPTDSSTPMTSHGIKVFIEPMALFNVVGTTMDWETNELTSEFTFNNPNSKGECGCGESFNV